MVTGSEKQMKWYEEILKEAYDYLDARYNHKIADEVEKQAVSLVRAEMEKALKNITEASRYFEVHICPNCLMWSDDPRAVKAREIFNNFKRLQDKECVSISSEQE